MRTKLLKPLAVLLAVITFFSVVPIGNVIASSSTFTTKINGTTRTFTQGTNVGGHYSAGCIIEAGKTTWTSTNHDSGHYCCFNNATALYQGWWGSTPDHHYDNFLWDVPETPNTTDNIKKWLSVSEPGSRVTIGNTYGNYNGHTVIYLGVDPSDSNYMWIINTNGHGYGLNPVERVSWSYLPTYLSSSYSKIISIQWPGAASEYSKRMSGSYNPHTHSYNTYVYDLAAHPHYKCYRCSCGDVKENVNEPVFYDNCEQCIDACKPKNVSVMTDKQSYNVGEAVTITPSGEGVHHYTMKIYYGDDDTAVCEDLSGFTGNNAYVPSQQGTYIIRVSAVGERNYYTDAECTFVVEGEIDPTQFSAWSTVLPTNVTETEYDIETKTMYRYRDNTTTPQYGAWGANQTTNTRPTESDMLQIVSTTKYYNYYHYCCNFYDGSWNVDSKPYPENSTTAIYHTYQSTTELSPTGVGDMGGKTLYGNHACEKNFLVWAKAPTYETYTYTYHTRTVTQVTVNGAWSSWQDTKPATANNRDIEQRTYYRYKLKAHEHTESDWIIDREAQIGIAGSKHKECTVCHTVLETEEIPALIIIDENTPQIIVESKKVRPGGTVDATIALKNNPGIASLKLKVDFNSDLTLTGVVYNDSIGGASQQPQTMDSPVTLNWYNGAANSNGDFTFVTLTFNVAETAQVGYKNITLSYDPDDVYNIDENNIEFAVVGGNIEVISYIPGDINGDDKVNNKDLTRLFQYLSNWDVEVNEAALDVNGDGKKNNKDLTRLFQYLSNWDVPVF